GRSVRYAGLRALLDAFLQRIGLLGFEPVELILDLGESQFLAIVDEQFALDVQFLRQVKNPDFLLFGVFRLRIRQAELLWRCSEQPPNPPAYRGYAGSTDRAPNELYSNPAEFPEKGTWDCGLRIAD